MIKRVILNKKTQYPEYDENSFYIYKDIYFDYYKLIKNKFNDFELVKLNSNLNDVFSRFPNFEEVCKWSERNPIFKFDSLEDVARFINNQLTVSSIDKYIRYNVLKDNEVSIDDVSSSKIYAYTRFGHIYKAHIINSAGRYAFRDIDCLHYYKDFIYPSLVSLIENVIQDAIVYQFDTQKEFFKWALEQITGKKFKNVVVPKRYIGFVDTFNACQYETVEALI